MPNGRWRERGTRVVPDSNGSTHVIGPTAVVEGVHVVVIDDGPPGRRIRPPPTGWHRLGLAARCGAQCCGDQRLSKCRAPEAYLSRVARVVEPFHGQAPTRPRAPSDHLAERSGQMLNEPPLRASSSM